MGKRTEYCGKISRDLLGQEVMTKSSNDAQSQIDMSNLASGTYLVKVTADNQIKTIKIIKE